MTLLGPGHESAAVAHLNTWRVFHPPPSDQPLLSLLLRKMVEKVTSQKRFYEEYHHIQLHKKGQGQETVGFYDLSVICFTENPS